MKRQEGKRKGIFITGTDTGVGKTFIGAAIAGSLHEQGIDVGVMKPAETGCRSRDGRLMPRDARILLKASSAGDPLDLVNPYRFPAPLAPMIAAELAGAEISLRRIVAAYRELKKGHEFMIVEGAGGIMVPLSRRTSYLDLAEAVGLPVLIVARPGLGTINHTVLTVMALRARNISVAAIVLNHLRTARKGAAERTNPAAIRRLTGLPVIECPFGGAGIPSLVAALGITA